MNGDDDFEEPEKPTHGFSVRPDKSTRADTILGGLVLFVTLAMCCYLIVFVPEHRMVALLFLTTASTAIIRKL